jgi:hypothetical protein
MASQKLEIRQSSVAEAPATPVLKVETCSTRPGEVNPADDRSMKINDSVFALAMARPLWPAELGLSRGVDRPITSFLGLNPNCTTVLGVGSYGVNVAPTHGTVSRPSDITSSPAIRSHRVGDLTCASEDSTWWRASFS